MEPATSRPKLTIEVWRTVDREEAGSSKAGLREDFSPSGRRNGRGMKRLVAARCFSDLSGSFSDSHFFFIDKD